MWTISSIKASAMEKFKANYGSSVLVLVLAGIIILAAESLGSIIPLVPWGAHWQPLSSWSTSSAKSAHAASLSIITGTKAKSDTCLKASPPVI